MKPGAMATPRLSVVIPTFERPTDLARTLDSLAPGTQTLASDHYEVIVTDAGATFTAESLIRHSYSWATWTAAPGRYPGANRNHGARRASGEWLVFLDDDCVVDGDFLSRIAARATSELDVIEGKIVCPDALDRPLAYCPYNVSGGLFWSANLAVRRDRFFALGAFDEDLGRLEDMEFAHRIRTRGVRTAFADDAVAYHPRHDQSFVEYWRRSLQQRWTLLYRIKTSQSVSLQVSNIRALGVLVAGECLNLLRTTSHLVSRPDASRWRSRVFAELWKWVTFPVILPYLMWWEIRFRHALREGSWR